MGDVFCIAVLGDTLFIGGGFSMVDNIEVHQIARYQGGSWSSVGTGLDGSVFSLLILGRCLYAGGAFDSFAKRLCISPEGNEFSSGTSWVPISNLSGPVHVLSALTSGSYMQTDLRT
jgi:hypothetical protein